MTLSSKVLCGGVALGLLVALACQVGARADKKFTPEELAFFDKQVLPILEKNCFRCHSSKKQRGHLRLDSRAAIFKGGDLGPAVLLDKPDDSRLLKAIHYRDRLEMPPSGKLSAEKLDILTRWVKMGIPYSPAKEVIATTPEHKEMKITAADRAYWAYRPASRPAVPRVDKRAWVKNPIDAFILAKLEAKGLAPAPVADRITLIRRASYDLTGLPPPPEEIDSFMKDRSPDAWEKLVDRLLTSQGYGEKWGRHWLDLVRFAETHGYERDSPKPFAWRYRDYVINSFNADKPYDRFVQEQLAGDELDDPTSETMIATGYYRLGIWDDEPADRLQLKYDVLDGIATTTSQVVLGMTVGCARCHDHKKDPIPQKDYYRLLAFFSDVTDMDGRSLQRVATPADFRVYQESVRARQEREGKLYQEQYRLTQKFLSALASKKGISAGRLIGSDMVDLSYRFYRDTWDKLPDFDALKPEDKGKVGSGYFSLAPASRLEAIGLVFEGKLKVPAKGSYTFFLESTDGARLIVDGKRVIDQPGKGVHKAEAATDLPAGLVNIRLEYFNTTAKPVLNVAWVGPGMARRSLSEEPGQEHVLVPDSRKAGVHWQYTLARPAQNWMQADFDSSKWKKSNGGFGRIGTPGTVVRTLWHSKNIWLRKTFEVAEIPTGLALSLHHDDDVEVYLNGKLIYRSGGYLVEYRRYPLGQEALAALRKGTNVLAVHCYQTTGGQYIDAGLLADNQTSLDALLRQHGRTLLGQETLDRYYAVKSELETSRKAKLPPPGLDVMCVLERGQNTMRVLKRGNPHVPGDVVTPGFPSVLTDAPVKLPVRKGSPTSGKRRALAEWLTSRTNVVTARTMANRVWQYHFGRGIVPTSSDFGKLGEPPTHPELLNWLASELVAGDWHLKKLHRIIMLSNAYQMSSKGNPQTLAKDPANHLFWRFNMRRLAAEEIRDSILAVGGTLNRRSGGAGIYPTIAKEVLAGQSVPGGGWGKSPPEEQARRSVYIHVKRSLIMPILETHDQADTDSSCAVRYTTTVPTQALGMLNGDFTNEQAALLAARLTSEFPNDLAGQVRRSVRLTTGRVPSSAVVKQDIAFIKGLQTENKLDEKAALKLYCLLALNANEFVYLD